MAVLSTIVQIPALPMCDMWQQDSLGSPIASEFVCDDHAWMPLRAFQELTKESHRGETVALRLHQDVDHCTMLIDCSP